MNKKVVALAAICVLAAVPALAAGPQSFANPKIGQTEPLPNYEETCRALEEVIIEAAAEVLQASSEDQPIADVCLVLWTTLNAWSDYGCADEACQKNIEDCPSSFRISDDIYKDICERNM